MSKLGSILATDLDGTFIPLDDSHEQRSALSLFHKAADSGELELIYVTGRHRESVLGVMQEQDLPHPNWIICDVGTTVLANRQNGYQLVDAYRNFIFEHVRGTTASMLTELFHPHQDLILQEDEKQGIFKLSFYCHRENLREHSQRLEKRLHQADLPYQVTCSVDPFNGDGLIDLLPSGVDKAGALRWWIQFNDYSQDGLVFAGDSGNDLAALTSGIRAILVGNAGQDLRQKVLEHHTTASTMHRLYVAKNHATAGVLEGCRWFGLL